MKSTALIYISSQTISSLVGNILKRKGYSVEFAKDYYDLIGKSKSSLFPLIVLSDTISTRDGYEVAKRVKTFDVSNTKNIIILNVKPRLVEVTSLEEQRIYTLDIPFRDETLGELLTKIESRKKGRHRKRKVLIFLNRKNEERAIVEGASSFSYKPIIANNIDEMCSLAYKEKPDAILLDIDKRKKDIYNSITCLRENKSSSKIPIILVTRKKNIFIEKQRAFDYGLSDFLQAPLNAEATLEYVDSLVENIRSPGKKTVLVFSEKKPIRLMLGHILGKNRFACEISASSRAVMNRLKRKKIASIILDVDLDNKVRVLNLIKEIRASVKYATIPIIVLIGRDAGDILQPNFDVEFFDYVRKPFLEASFVHRIKNTLLFKNVIDNLEFQNKQLSSVNKNSKDLIKFAAYDMRNPISLIRNYADLDKYKERTFEGMEKALSVIRRQANLVLNIVDTTLNYQSMESGKVTLEKNPTNIFHVFNTCIKNNEEFISERELSIVMDVKDRIPRLNLDRQKFYEMINNLLQNSMRNSKQKGEIVISISLLDYEDDFYSIFDDFSNTQKSKKDAGRFVEIRFVDRGKTIPETVKKRIFRPLVKKEGEGDSQTMNLGLYIARNIATAHGGKIWLEPENESDGNAFVVLLPVPKIIKSEE